MSAESFSNNDIHDETPTDPHKSGDLFRRTLDKSPGLRKAIIGLTFFLSSFSVAQATGDTVKASANVMERAFSNIGPQEILSSPEKLVLCRQLVGSLGGREFYFRQLDAQTLPIYQDLFGTTETSISAEDMETLLEVMMVDSEPLIQACIAVQKGEDIRNTIIAKDAVIMGYIYEDPNNPNQIEGRTRVLLEKVQGLRRQFEKVMFAANFGPFPFTQKYLNQIAIFDPRATGFDVFEAFKHVPSSNCDAIIKDIQNNPGNYVPQWADGINSDMHSAHFDVYNRDGGVVLSGRLSDDGLYIQYTGYTYSKGGSARSFPGPEIQMPGTELRGGAYYGLVGGREAVEAHDGFGKRLKDAIGRVKFHVNDVDINFTMDWGAHIGIGSLPGDWGPTDTRWEQSTNWQQDRIEYTEANYGGVYNAVKGSSRFDLDRFKQIKGIYYGGMKDAYRLEVLPAGTVKQSNREFIPTGTQVPVGRQKKQ